MTKVQLMNVNQFVLTSLGNLPRLSSHVSLFKIMSQAFGCSWLQQTNAHVSMSAFSQSIRPMSGNKINIHEPILHHSRIHKVANEGGKGPFFFGYREKDFGNCSNKQNAYCLPIIIIFYLVILFFLLYCSQAYDYFNILKC